MRNTWKILCAILALCLVLPGAGLAGPQKVRDAKAAGPVSLSTVNNARHALETAHAWQLSAQQEDGSWKHDPAITALSLYSMLVPPVMPTPETEKALTKGFAFLKQFVQEDGGIYQKGYRNYVTAVSLLAFTQAGLPEYAGIIKNAKDFLIEFQLDESEEISEDHPYYGGIGYGGDDRPDLSNTQLALEAIRAAEIYDGSYKHILPATATAAEKEEKELGLHWKKALVFLDRCQNVKAVNSMPYATDDGGFIYETGTYKPERSHSYGSMTYAGAKSLLYAKVDRDDIRVKKAMEWIKNNYTLEENPNFGTVSLYYYYLTFAKCLDAMGEDQIPDPKGGSHNWREDLTTKLISLQKGDGTWVNDNGRFWENVPELATAYSVVAMKYALDKNLN